MKTSQLHSLRILFPSWLLLLWVVVAVGCQTAAPGLHDQLVRGSAVPPEETSSKQPSWWSEFQASWRFWFGGTTSDAPAVSATVNRAVHPDDVTPATAWHVLQQLRDEIERDRANPQD